MYICNRLCMDVLYVWFVLSRALVHTYVCLLCMYISCMSICTSLCMSCMYDSCLHVHEYIYTYKKYTYIFVKKNYTKITSCLRIQTHTHMHTYTHADRYLIHILHRAHSSVNRQDIMFKIMFTHTNAYTHTYTHSSLHTCR